MNAGIGSNFQVYAPPASTPLIFHFIHCIRRKQENCVLCVVFLYLFNDAVCDITGGFVFKDMGRRISMYVRLFSECRSYAKECVVVCSDVES
jgi:hypothetical protein